MITIRVEAISALAANHVRDAARIAFGTWLWRFEVKELTTETGPTSFYVYATTLESENAERTQLWVEGYLHGAIDITEVKP